MGPPLINFWSTTEHLGVSSACLPISSMKERCDLEKPKANSPLTVPTINRRGSSHSPRTKNLSFLGCWSYLMEKELWQELEPRVGIPDTKKITLEHVSSLLEDPSFMHPDGATPGTIMILAHYKEAVNRYQGAINRLFSKQSKRRVQVRTVDTAQGQEADVVVLDLVNDHQTVHIANQKRLCVALTRARQAEVILVHGNVLQGDLRKLYDQCFSGDEGTVLDVNNKLSSPPSPAWERE